MRERWYTEIGPDGLCTLRRVDFEAEDYGVIGGSNHVATIIGVGNDRLRLIAKAPELLECLQTLLDEVAHGQPTVGAAAKGCALIAEIEGGEV